MRAAEKGRSRGRWRLGVAASAWLAASGTATPAAAGWHGTIVIGQLRSSNDYQRSEVAEAIRSRGEIDDATVLELVVRRDLGRRFALGFGVARASPIARFIVEKEGQTFIDTDRLEMMPLWAELVLRLPGGSWGEPYLTAGPAWVRYGDLRFFASEGLDSEDHLGWTASLGVDLELGQPGGVAVRVAARYLDSALAGTEMDEPDSGSFDLDSLSISAGLTWSWGERGRR